MQQEVKLACHVCGKPALYKANNKGACREHKTTLKREGNSKAYLWRGAKS